MDGITILSVSENIIYGTGWNPCCTFLLVPLILSASLFLLGLVVEDGGMFAGGLIGLLIFGGLCYYTYRTNGEVGTYPIYKVTIDESVSFEEFNKRYEVINQDGLIYEIKERIE